MNARLAHAGGQRKSMSVSDPLLAGCGLGSCHTTVVEQMSHQQSVRTRPQRLVIGLLFIQLGLDCIEEFPIKNGRLLTGEGLTFECDLANLKPISEQVCQTAPGERNAADGRACLQGAELGDDALPAQVRHQQVEAAKLKIATENDRHRSASSS